MDPVRWKLSAEAMRLWLPIVLSLSAISLSIYQASATRQHMRLSVQPRLDWNVAAERDGDLVFSLINVGFGPAVLGDIALTVDGKPVGPDGVETCAKLDAALGRGAPDWETGCFDKVGDFVIRAGDSVVVYASRRVEGAPLPASAPRPEDYLRVGVTGRYCSFYEECWPLR